MKGGLKHTSTILIATLLTMMAPAVAMDESEERPYERGQKLFKERQYAEAIHQFDEAIKMDGNAAKSWVSRGLCHSKLGQYHEAIEDYTHALGMNPTMAVAYNNRGASYLYLSKYSEALNDFDKAVRYDPKYPDAFSNRGFAKIRLGRFAESLDDINNAISLKPDFALAYTNLSMAEAHLGHYTLAIQACTTAIKLNPSMASAYNNRAASYLMMGETTKSVEDFDKALKLAPNDLDARNNRAAAYLTLGRTADAVKDMQKALDSGIWDQAGAATTIIYCCVGLLKLHNTEAVKQLAEQAERLLKNKPWTHKLIRYLSAQISAEDLLEGATNKSERSEAECYIGMRLTSEGDDGKALEHFKSALDCDDKTSSEYNLAKAEIDRIEKILSDTK